MCSAYLCVLREETCVEACREVSGVPCGAATTVYCSWCAHMRLGVVLVVMVGEGCCNHSMQSNTWTWHWGGRVFCNLFM